MGKFRVEVTKTALKDIERHIKSGNKKDCQTIEKILIELENDPFKGIGKPEKLKYDYIGFWSRRINKKDRLIYKIIENEVVVFVVSAIGHYNDK